jgi:protein phosphatase 1L
MPLRAHLPPPIRGCLGALAKVWLSFLMPQMASGVQSIAFGHYLIKGKSRHAMEDYFVAEVRNVNEHELGLFAIYDGHLGHHVADYLQRHLFNNILNETGFWKDPKLAIRKAYLNTDGIILENAPDLGPGGSTAVTAILIDSKTLYVANVGDSRAIVSKAGNAEQLSVDHEPGNSTERGKIEEKGGFVSNMPGDVPRVDGQLAVARAFGDKSLKVHLSATPDIKELKIDDETELLILASDGLWKVMENQEAVDLVKKIKDPTAAAKQLAQEAVNRKSKDDISCIVVRFA